MSDDDAAFEKIADPEDADVLGAARARSARGRRPTVITEDGAGRYGVLCFIPAPEGHRTSCTAWSRSST